MVDNNIDNNKLDNNNNTITLYFRTIYDFIYKDIKKSYNFIIENRIYFVYIIILAILIQFTSIHNLTLYCTKLIQRGGDNKPSTPLNIKLPSIPSDNKSTKTLNISSSIKSEQIDNESKINQKRIGFFENIKQGFGNKSNQKMSVGPIFGSINSIMGSVKTIFYILAIILTIAGIISIPVLIFLIITYMVLKFALKRITVL